MRLDAVEMTNGWDQDTSIIAHVRAQWNVQNSETASARTWNFCTYLLRFDSDTNCTRQGKTSWGNLKVSDSFWKCMIILVYKGCLDGQSFHRNYEYYYTPGFKVRLNIKMRESDKNSQESEPFDPSTAYYGIRIYMPINLSARRRVLNACCEWRGHVTCVGFKLAAVGIVAASDLMLLNLLRQ